MGLRKDFLIHKAKTVESFKFVRLDISSLNANIEHLRNAINSLDSRMAAISNDVLALRQAVDKYSLNLSMQQNANSAIESKINDVGKSVDNTFSTLNSFKKKISNLASRNKKISKNVSMNNNLIKKVVPMLRAQSLKSNKLNSAFKNTEKETRKVKNLLKRKIRTTKRADNELESKLKNQRKRILQLNRKIESKKLTRKAPAKRKISKTKRIVEKTITPKKTIIKTVTPKRTVTKAVTPKRKKIVEIIKSTNKPLI